MRNKLNKITADPNFILKQLNIPFYVQTETLNNTLKHKPFAGLTGLYILFDDTLGVTWYVGQSASAGSTKRGGIHARIGKHHLRAMGTYDRKNNPPMINWDQLENWLKVHQYNWSDNTEIFAIIIDLPLLMTTHPLISSKQVLDDSEFQLIQYTTLHPYLNNESYHHSRLSTFAPLGSVPQVIKTLKPIIG